MAVSTSPRIAAADHQLLRGNRVSGGLVGGNVLTPLKPAAFAGPPRALRPTSSTIAAPRFAPGG
jgi:hypothetical protein